MPETVPCPGCSGARFETIHEDCPDLWLAVPGTFPVVSCRECGLVQTNPRPTASELKAYYPDEYQPGGSPPPNNPMGSSAPIRWFRKLAALPYRLKWRWEFVSGLEPGRALDVGAGNGIRLARLSAGGWEPWLMEPRRDLARKTSEALGIPADHAVVAYAEDAELPEEHFDLIIMDHVVEHLSDPRAVFDSIASWLKPGGRLLITCPNYGSLESRLLGRWWMGLDMPRHLLHFGTKTLSRMAAEAGLEVEDLRPQYGVLMTSSMVLRRASERGVGEARSFGVLAPFERVITFGAELVVTAAQPFGYMPMMEVTFVKPEGEPYRRSASSASIQA
ncbi:MAG: class I SAM-dependent methyltransferase [Solirubrobacterales bacterium]